MKKVTTPAIFVACIIGLFWISNRAYSQGNSGGNANNNNNANGNALKWETQGNNADANDFIGTTNSTALKIRTNNEERLRITPDGRIGAGILNPLERFELQGNLKLTGDIIFSDYADANDTTGRLLFVDKDGKTNPKNSSVLAKMIYVDNGCKEGNSGLPTWSHGDSKIYVRCPKDVKVGIGLESPQHKLHVVGNIKGRRLLLGRADGKQNTRSQIHVVSTVNTEDYIRFDQMRGGELETLFQVDQNGGLQIDYSGSDLALNISSESDGRKILQLHNDGLLRAREVKVDEKSWPDYVFKPDYDLMPLKEVKSFITENGHLPNVPSAEIVESEGVNLGETARITMEKVEELTLYTIEQQDQLDEQNKLIKNQQEQLDEQKSVIEAQQEVLKEQSELIEAQKKALEELMLKIGK